MNIEYDGHKIEPCSYQNDDMPGYWFPHAIVQTPAGESATVVLPPVRGIEKSEADVAALREAKRRIASKNL
jgi:hypothetical protein